MEAVMPAKPYSLSVKIIISDDKGRWLLLKRPEHSEWDWNIGKWDLPGGKLNPGESFEEALVREVKEETGLTISMQEVYGAVGDEIPTNRIAHLVMTGKLVSGEVNLSTEHVEYAWIPPEKINEMELCNYLYGLLEI
jgi:8-oxo-dGTP diphosphatase